VPAHWEISRLGFESWVRARLGWRGLKADEYVADGYAFLSTPNIKGAEIDFENVNFIDDIRYQESPEIMLRVGDVLLAKDGSTLGTVNVVRGLPRPSTVNSSIAVISPRGRLNGVYLSYLFQSDFMVATIQRIKDGMGVPHLFQEDLNKFYLPIPPLVEQQAIATFLDRETHRLDTLVAEQRQLIALLSEKRQAVISRAATRGLSGDAPIRPSGIESLGDVPAHWQVNRLRNLFRQEKRQNVSGKEVLSVYRDFGVIPKSSRDDNFNKTPEDLSSYQLVRIGDLVVNKMKAWQGSLGISEFEGITSPDYMVFSPHHEECPGFLHYLLRCQQLVSGYRSISNGIRPSQWRLEPEAFLGRQVFLPPLEEQEAIVASITSQIHWLDILSAEATQAIALMEERRTALTSAAVTGKIDVRSVA
jgi:type I restriction enzyme S subunit